MESRQSNKKNKKNTQQNTGLRILPLTAKTGNQKRFLQHFNNYQAITLTGFAGVGKTFLALYKALEAVEKELYKSVMIVRSSVSSRNIGFLPGNKKEKMEVFEGPYMSNCAKLYGRADAYSILKQKGIIQFEGSSFFRGETFDDMVIIVDEAQNMSFQELFTILTRLGENSKIIICGDGMQDDLTSERYKEESGLGEIMTILRNMTTHTFNVDFGIDDIVRSGFVKELLIAYSNR